jgi:hypothetical protein
MLPLRMVQIYGTVEPQPKGTPSMKYLVTGAAIAVALTAAAPAFAQSSEFLNSAELYRLAVLRAQAAPAPLPYPLAPYPFYPATADPKTYPLPYYPFAPLATVPGTGGNWKWENGAYHWYPNS